MSDPSRYEIVMIAGHDLPTVAELRREILDEGVAPLPHEAARAEWLYSKNPAGPAEILGLRERGGPWVGMVAIIPRQIWIDGTEHAGAYLCDFYVHPNHRSLLPALTLQKAARQHLADLGRLNYTIPNERSLPIFRRLGADQTLLRHRWARPIRTKIFLERRDSKIAVGIAPALDAALFALDLLLSFGAPALQAQWLETFDERFDDLWTASTKTGLCIGERSARYLRWRFQDEPGHINKTVGLVDRRSGRLQGYVTGELIDQEFAIRDCLTAALTGRRAGIWSHALLAIRALGAAGASIRLAGSEPVTQAISRAGFRRRDPEIAFVHGRAAAGPRRWHLTTADEDV